MLRVLTLFSVVTLLVVAAAPPPADAKGGGSPNETFRISGGDLPHPVTVSVPEYLMTVSGRGAWYAAVAGVPAPPASLARYQLDVVDPASGAPLEAAQQYVPGAPARITTPDGPGWAEPIPEIAQLLDRYIALGSRGLLPERPTFAQALSAAAGAFGVEVSADRTRLAPDDTAHALSLIEEARPVVFGVRGTLIGSRDLHPVPLIVSFGGTKLHVTYVPPGPVASYGLLFDDRRVGNWEYITALNPPGYAQDAYTVPPEFDAFMSALGFRPSPASEIIEDRVVPLEQARFDSGIDHVEAWRDGASHVTLRAEGDEVIEAPCTPPSDCSRSPVLPSSGPSLNVQVWPEGLDPFPEAVSPAEYVYYPHDATGPRSAYSSASETVPSRTARSGLTAPCTQGRCWTPSSSRCSPDLPHVALISAPPSRSLCRRSCSAWPPSHTRPGTPSASAPASRGIVRLRHTAEPRPDS